MKKKTERVREVPSPVQEYDFSGGTRGKYAARYAKGTNIVVLAEDVARAYPNSRAVNAALRKLMRAQAAQSRR